MNIFDENGNIKDIKESNLEFMFDPAEGGAFWITDLEEDDRVTKLTYAQTRILAEFFGEIDKLKED